MNDRIQYVPETGALLIEILLDKLDLFETPNVLADIENALKDNSAPAVIVNLKEVTSLDSSGIGLLIAVRNGLSKKNIPLLVVCASETVLQIFRLTKVQQLIPVFLSKEEAFASLVK